ncbi:MAG: hypothetical protein A4S09_13130 [Proteobacteria bacterium SG_bin7]|nr:MAG: hypothetical protein A4S09_13130 [Proteobacteria bacterium SG_bin7]
MNCKKIFTIYLPLLIISIIIWPKLPTQDSPAYFNFAGEPSHNILSNIPFLLVGLFGILSLRWRKITKINFLTSSYIFSLGIILTAFGSTYFHAYPTPETLFWDRLPMAITFSGMLGVITTDRLFPQLKTGFIYLILLISILTVINWSFGNRDLRPYLIIQFVGGFYVFLTAICTPSNILANKKVFLSTFFYVLAKVFEVYDLQTLETLKITNGHTLKHFSAAISALLLLP